MNQPDVDLVKLLAQELKRWPFVVGQASHQVIQSPQRFTHRNLQLLKAARMRFRITFAPIELQLAYFSVVAQLPEQRERIPFTTLGEKGPYLAKVLATDLYHQLRAADGIAFPSESCLKPSFMLLRGGSKAWLCM